MTCYLQNLGLIWLGLHLIHLQVSLSQAWPGGAQGQSQIICLQFSVWPLVGGQ